MIGKVNFSYYTHIEVNFTLFLLVKTPENLKKGLKAVQILYKVAEIYFSERKK